MKWLPALCAISLLACGAPPSGPPCDVRTERLDLALTTLANRDRVPVAAMGVTLVDLPDGQPVRRDGLSIVVTAGGEVWFRGQSLGRNRGELAAQLEQALRYREDVLYVAADAETTLGILDEITATVPFGIETRLVGNGGGPTLDVYQDRLRERPSVKRFRAEVEQLHAGERAVHYAKRLEREVGNRCAPVKLVFQRSMAMGLGVERAVARDLPAGLRECKCDVPDVDLLEYLLYDMFGGWDAPQTWIDLRRQHGLADATVADLARG